jgi:uncharacterized membrane protein
MMRIPFILFALLVASSILSLLALSAVRRIEALLKTFPLNELTGRIYQLEQRLAQLQKLVSSQSPAATEAVDRGKTVETPTPIPQSSSPPHPAPPPPMTGHSQPVQPARPASVPPATVRPAGLALRPAPAVGTVSKEPSASDLEALIGGRWFNRIGIIALLFAVSYFLKLAFDNNWIGPAGRVAIGILLGAAMLPWSEWLLTRGYGYFSEGIAGLGEATLFVSVWAGCQYYTLFSRQTGFAALVLITIVMAYLALRRDSQRIAFVSLLGGLLTPALMSTGKNEQVMLFSYLLCLGMAALVVSWRRNWHSLLALAFGGTFLYFWQWYDSFYNRGLFLERTLLFATLFFFLYAVTPVLRGFRQSNLTVTDLFLVAANAGSYSLALHVMLWPEHRGVLALLFILLAAGHLMVSAVWSGTDSDSWRLSVPRFLYLGLAVAFLTMAIPARFDGNSVTLFFAAEGGALAWLGFRYHAALLRPAGYILLAVAAFRLLVNPPSADMFLWNERFASYLILIAGFIAPLWAASESQSDNAEAEIACLSVTANCFALLALSLEIWDYFGRGNGASNHALAQHLSISVLWTCYAAALIAFGLIRRSALLRWQSLILLGIVVIKVFFIDLSSLDRAYRIVSFLILGSVLLAVSFLYQRKQARERK